MHVIAGQANCEDYTASVKQVVVCYWRCIGCGGGFCWCSKRQGATAFLDSNKYCHRVSMPLLNQDANIGLPHHLLTLRQY